MSEITELLERFRQGGTVLEAAAAGPGDVDAKEPGKWSVRQILAHVADAEVVWAMRFRQLIAEDNPTMAGWDQEKWTERLDYARRDPAKSLATFRQLREENALLLEGVDEEAFQRTGTHTLRGTMSLRDFLKMATDHLESHAKQICAMRAD